MNYLIPVDFDAESGKEKYYSMPVTYVLERMNSEKRIVILDACRSISKGQSGGLAAMNHPHTFISFAAAPGETSLDGEEGKLSPYTEALIEALDTPNLSIHVVFSKVNGIVQKKTSKTQIPYVNHCFTETEDVIFNKQP